jgi:toxin-antitoxin system PIN domain toxin
MIVRLLDVNLLISLLDTAHVHNAVAVEWFRAIAAVEGWATAPITENGFIRVVCQVSYPNLKLTPGGAAAMLGRFKSNFAGIHRFWPDEISMTDTSIFDLPALTGSRQITDVYLAGLAYRKGGRLATLDASVAWRAVVGGKADLIERVFGY